MTPINNPYKVDTIFNKYNGLLSLTEYFLHSKEL